MMKEAVEIRNQLASHLKGGEAFMPIDALLKEIKSINKDMLVNSLEYLY